MGIESRAILKLIGNAACSVVYAWSMFASFFKTYFTNFIIFQETVWNNLPSEPRIVHIKISNSKIFLCFYMLKILKIPEQFF